MSAPLFLKWDAQFLVQPHHLLFAADAARHRGLVAGHDDQEAGAVQGPHRGGGEREEFDFGKIADIAAVPDQRAVAVEENRLFHGATVDPSSQSSPAAARTSSAPMAVMQRWSVGQRRRRQGAQSAPRCSRR